LMHLLLDAVRGGDGPVFAQQGAAAFVQVRGCGEKEEGGEKGELGQEALGEILIRRLCSLTRPPLAK